jgi:hypothetical protein
MAPYYSGKLKEDGNFVTWDQAIQSDPPDCVEKWEITLADFNRIKAGDIPTDPTPE